MRNTFFTLLLISVLSTGAHADAPLCAQTNLEFNPQRLVKSEQIRVFADNAQLIQDTTAQFEGSVVITSNKAIINADNANINDSGREVIARGDVLYRDQQLQVESQNVELNTNLKLLQMQDTEYRLQSISGRGNSSLLSISDEQGLQLDEVSFTTCPRGGEDWKIQASSISIAKDSPFGEAYNTRFYLGGVPVFYLPYFAFPVTTERQSGLLFPKFGSSSTVGIEYEQPIYWNIAPNYDATISPRYMSERGLQLKTEFRYLSAQHKGELQLEYLANDLDTQNDQDRYFYRLSHQGNFGHNWHVNLDISGLSDDNYIVDLGSDYYNRADTHLYRLLGFNYYSDNLDMSLQFRDFEVIGDQPDGYRALPEIKLNYEQLISSYIEFNVSTEMAYFQNPQEQNADAFRVHVQPSVILPYRRAWGELLAEVSLLSTYYQQETSSARPEIAKEVTRHLGQARLYASLVFEKDQQVLGESYKLTVEPKAQYLYTSYQNQSMIGRYDTTDLLTNFSNLFRGQDFTGLDRINDNNQLTIGATARLLDDSNREQLALSIGQIFYLQDAKLLGSLREQERSALAAELDWQLNQRWFLHSDIQVAVTTDKVERSSIATEYRITDNKLIQLNHRFIRDLSGETINQVGVTASWPLAKNWQWVGRWYRDTERSRTSESFFGVQYESCCWALRLTAQRHLSNRFDVTGSGNINEFDTGIALQFTFKGLGSSKSGTDMLEQGLFGYRQPYILNQ